MTPIQCDFATLYSAAALFIQAQSGNESLYKKSSFYRFHILKITIWRTMFRDMLKISMK